MRILWHGAHPDLPTGYANQARVWLPRLGQAGYDVAMSCLAGITSHMAVWHPGGNRRPIPVYPCTPYETLGQDVVRGHYEHWQADLAISLTCTWVYNPLAWRDMRTVFITPVDIPGMSVKDAHVITESGGTPAAVCRWGETQMRARGFDPLYLPHGIDTSVYKPPRNRKGLRQAQGFDQHFLVGVCAANHERARKNMDELFGAFSVFHGKHPKSLLLLHTIGMLPEGLNLWKMADVWGITDACVFSDQYQQIIGAVTWESMAAWYGALDVLVMVGNEGFGLPTVEAMACGTPVIAGDWGPTPELTAGTGWLVEGQPAWNNWHGAHWRTPFISSIVDQLELAHGEARERRSAAREAALAWDADRMWEEHWAPAMKDLDG